MISVIFLFLENKEIVNMASLCKKFNNAMKNEFIWEGLASRHQLFLPEEAKNFTHWKDYLKYLFKLIRNPLSGSPKSYKQKAFRGHKKPITALTTLRNSKVIDYSIVSGDEDGVLLVWDIDEDGDFEGLIIGKLEDGIEGIKGIYEDKKVVAWDRKGKFVVFNILPKDTSLKESERFKKEIEFSLGSGNIVFKEVEYDEENDILVCIPDLSDKSVLLNYNSIFIYNFKDNISKEIGIMYDFSENQRLKEIKKTITGDKKDNTRPTRSSNSSQFENKIFGGKNKPNLNLLVQSPSFLFISIKYDPIYFYPMPFYWRNDNNPNIPNLLRLTKSSLQEVFLKIDFREIYSLIKIKKKGADWKNNDDNSQNSGKNIEKNEEIGVLGDKNGLLFFSVFSADGEEKRNITICYQTIDKINRIDLLLDENYPEWLGCLINAKHVTTISNINNNNLYSMAAFYTKLKEDYSINEINCVHGDKHRILIICDSDFHITTLSTETGEKWYVLLAGSQTVVPKSFVPNPNFKNFNKLLVTRRSIFAVLGNLFREYCFGFK